MRRSLHVPALRTVLLAGLALAPKLGALPESARVIGPPPGLEERTEDFVLELDPSSAGEGAAREIGLAEWRRRRIDGAWQLELDLSFRASGIRVFAVERLDPGAPRLVWREVSPGAGRTVLAEWTERGAGLRTLEWGIDGSLRERCDASEGAVMPLYLVELLRLGRLGVGAQLTFDPLARGLERLRVRTSYASRERGAGFDRVVELARGDGSLAGRYVFHGDSLVGFRWQEGGWSARRIEGDEYARRLRAKPPAGPASRP